MKEAITFGADVHLCIMAFEVSGTNKFHQEIALDDIKRSSTVQTYSFWSLKHLYIFIVLYMAPIPYTILYCSVLFLIRSLYITQYLSFTGIKRSTCVWYVVELPGFISHVVWRLCDNVLAWKESWCQAVCAVVMYRTINFHVNIKKVDRRHHTGSLLLYLRYLKGMKVVQGNNYSLLLWGR